MSTKKGCARRIGFALEASVEAILDDDLRKVGLESAVYARGE